MAGRVRLPGWQAPPGLAYVLAPRSIVHSRVEVSFAGVWVNLEGFILDRPYLQSVQRRFSAIEGAFCGFGVATLDLQGPPVEWKGADTYIQKEEDMAAICKRIRQTHMRLITVTDGEITALHMVLKATMDALFLKDLAQKTRRGPRGHVEAGLSSGGKGFGYRVVRRLLADGTPATGEREIDPAKASVVARIFAEYASGPPPRKIVARLNAEGITRAAGWPLERLHHQRQPPARRRHPQQRAVYRPPRLEPAALRQGPRDRQARVLRQ